jgi:tetratricopeptide (TPR) repeat protein
MDDEYVTAGGSLHAVLHCNRAACFMGLLWYMDAIKDCTAALRIFPHYMKAILRRARCYARLNRHEEAISEYTRWLQLVEEAKKSPRTSSSSISSCPFDKASDVSADDTKKSRAELAEVKKSKADAARTSQAEASFRASQQKWQRDKFSSSGTSTTSTNAHSRRDQYYNQQGGSGSRRWDSFNGTSPKKPGRTRTKASSNTGQQSSSSQPVESDDNASGTHYSVLELPSSATQADIKKAFRKVRIMHIWLSILLVPYYYLLNSCLHCMCFNNPVMFVSFRWL